MSREEIAGLRRCVKQESNPRCARSRPRSATAPAPEDARGAAKTGFPAQGHTKNILRERLTEAFFVLFCRPFFLQGVPPNQRNLEETATMAKKNAAPTKSEVLTTIAKETDLSKKQVGAVFESLAGVIKKSLRGNGLFTMPGLLKMKVVKRPATKAREGINPFTGEKMMFKAKPASRKVRVMALKNLKSFVN
jgi:nucleoid DNA-binding protein